MLIIVHVKCLESFEEEKIDYIIKNITKVFTDLGVPAQAVEILVHEVPMTHWRTKGLSCAEKFKDVDIPG
ncbi:MAG: 4-oxalocrotonate tautomerase [Methanobacterium sp. PtaU1.Bin097]|nr:MAG: 4-oxalocrotonate tautomerase [Methanobacterium sp. PtaU1.Bin097]